MSTISRAQQKESETWNLSALYTSLDAWRGDYQVLENRITEVSAFQGKLTSSVEDLRAATDFYLDNFRLLERLYNYAHLLSDADLGNSDNLGLLDQASNIYTRLAAAWSFFTPELLAADQQKVERLLADPKLKPYKRLLSDTFRHKPHTLSEREEQLLALGAEVFGSSRQIFSQLSNVDLDFGSLTIDGKDEPLTHESFILFLKNKSRDVRQQAFEQYYSEIDQHKNTLAASYGSSVKKDIYLMRVKNYSSAIDQALFVENIPQGVYRTLVTTARDRISSHHKYYALRKKHLKLNSQCVFDSYVPLVEDTQNGMPYDDAVNEICEALAPLGADYTKLLSKGLTSLRWVDRYENKGKRSGAYSSGCYDSPPYIMMNYKEQELDSVFTLAHEAGHSMHSYYSREKQSYQDSGYTIFVAEVASTLNEILLMEHLKKKHSADKKFLAFLINHQIDTLKGTFFRQTMFAEFEKRSHEIVEANEALTLDVIRDIYRELQQTYYGEALNLGELDDLECLRIPHFYSAFYVYKYATGISAAIALAEKILANEPGALDKYFGFLSAGCSKYPVELLRDAGVDMESSEPVEATINMFDSLVNELDQVLEELN